MMKSVILSLKSGSRFHFGRLGIDANSSLADTDEWLQSDVLFSAIINNLASTADEEFTNRFIAFFKDGSIKISSAFYCIQHEDNYEYLLPKPINATQFMQDYTEIKPIKKIKFLSHRLWNICPQQWKEAGVFTTDKRSVLFKCEKNQDIPCLFQKTIIPNVVIHKPTMDSKGPIALSVIQIPELERETFIHFYFLYEISENLPKEIKNAFRFAVELIPFNGLGGERSSGCGFVERVVWQDTPFPISEGICGLMTNAGLYIPTASEFENCLYYDYETRGGRKTRNNGTLKRVRMLKEGSIIRSSERLSGCTFYLDEGEHYLRYGQPICLTLPQFYGNE